MEVVNRENIKVPNSVIVSGLTDTELDEDVTEFLNKYGRIARTVRVDDPQSSYHRNVIVEYESGSALNTLKPMLPYDYESPNKVTYQIRALSSEYVPVATETATHNFLSELHKISKLSGKSFEEILHEQFSKFSESTELRKESTDALSTPEVRGDPVSPLDCGMRVHHDVEPADLGEPTSSSSKPISRATDSNDTSRITTSCVNPPEVQRMVVEHIVRSEAPVSQMNMSFRLRAFSGKVPCLNHEVDFDTWRNSVELIMQDAALSDLQRSRKILDSLSPPAADVVKPLGSQASPSAYLELLDSAFGTVEDGDELFAKFLNTFQDAGEKPSYYLHRLQTALTKAQRRGGVSDGEAGRHLLRQFCRGCWDNVLIADLELERKRDSPPSFSELLLQLRVEEDKNAAKENRMRKHLNATKQKVSSHNLIASSVERDSTLRSDISEMKKQVTELQIQIAQLRSQKTGPKAPCQSTILSELKKEVTELQSQLTSLKSHQAKAGTPKLSVKHPSKHRAPEGPLAPDQRPRDRPKPGYCFLCGEDGHISSACSKEPDPSLVAAKRAQLKARQSLWDAQHASSPAQPLN